MIRRAKRFQGDPLENARQQMIAQTGAFLSWALAQPHLPRIPSRPVAAGGYSHLRHEPEARARVASWWSGILESDWSEQAG